jgi:hypothetical protein
MIVALELKNKLDTLATDWLHEVYMTKKGKLELPKDLNVADFVRTKQKDISETMGKWRGWADKILTETIDGETEARVHAYFFKPRYHVFETTKHGVQLQMSIQVADIQKLNNICILNARLASAKVSEDKTEEEPPEDVAQRLKDSLNTLATDWLHEQYMTEEGELKIPGDLKVADFVREKQDKISKIMGNWKGWADKILTVTFNGEKEARVHA